MKETREGEWFYYRTENSGKDPRKPPLKNLAPQLHDGAYTQHPTTVVLFVAFRAKLHDTLSQRAMSYQALSH